MVEMKRLLFTLFALCLLPAASRAIDEQAARKIAEDEAGCGPKKGCETRARLENDQWVLIVSTISGYRDNGEPILVFGGWVGFTIAQDGTIVDRMPGR